MKIARLYPVEVNPARKVPRIEAGAVRAGMNAQNPQPFVRKKVALAAVRGSGMLAVQAALNLFVILYEDRVPIEP